MSSGTPLTAGQRTSSIRFRRCEVPRLMTQPPSQNPARDILLAFRRLPTQQRRIVALLRRFTPHLRRCHVNRTPPTPTEDRLPAWRRACLAYREIREAGGSDQQAHEAAVEAVQQVLPLLTQKEASAEAVSARLRHQVSQRLVLEGCAADKEVAGNGALACRPRTPAG